MSENVTQRIAEILSQNFTLPEKNESLLESLSSLELVQLVTELESAFKITISALEINEDTFKNAETLCDFIKRKRL